MNFNPHVLPGKPVSPRDHHREITIGVTAAVILVIIGGLYLWFNREINEFLASGNSQLSTEEQLAAFANAPVGPLSKETADQLNKYASEPVPKLSTSTRQQLIDYATK